MSDPTLTQIDDRELENMSVDAANFPYKKTRGMLYWNGSAWTKWDGILQAGTATIGSVKITGGTDTATVATAIDSRNGLDVQTSSMASKTFINENSLNTPSAGHFPLSASGTFDSGWIDTQGYGGLVLTAVDNTSGGANARLEEHWSNTGTDDIFTGSAGIYLVGGIGTFSLPFLFGYKRTIAARYVRYIWTQSTTAQATGSPGPENFTFFTAMLLPVPYPYDANIVNSQIAVVGTGSLTDQPVTVGGPDSIAAPTAITSMVVDSTGNVTVKGTATNYTSTPIVTATKLTTSASPGASTVSVAASSTQVFASNTDRLGFRIWNNGPEVVYIKYGSAATSTSNTYTILPYEELVVTNVGYSGVIHHIAPVATGTLVCNEW